MQAPKSSRSLNTTISLSNSKLWFLYSDRTKKKETISNKQVVSMIEEAEEYVKKNNASYSKWVTINNREQLMGC